MKTTRIKIGDQWYTRKGRPAFAGTRIVMVLDDALLAELTARGPIATAARDALTEYYRLLSAARSDLAARLSAEELTNLCSDQEYPVGQFNCLETLALLDALKRYYRAQAMGFQVDPATLLRDISFTQEEEG